MRSDRFFNIYQNRLIIKRCLIFICIDIGIVLLLPIQNVKYIFPVLSYFIKPFNLDFHIFGVHICTIYIYDCYYT